MNYRIYLGFFSLLLLNSQAIFAVRAMSAVNKTSWPMYVEFENNWLTPADCYFHFNGPIPAKDRIDSGTGPVCSGAGYTRAIVRVVGSGQKFTFDIPEGIGNRLEWGDQRVEISSEPLYNSEGIQTNWSKITVEVSHTWRHGKPVPITGTFYYNAESGTAMENAPAIG